MIQEFEQEWKGPRLGDRYAFEAAWCDILVGYPKRISIKALVSAHKACGNEALTMRRSGKSKAFHVEGPKADVEYLAAIAQRWRQEYAEQN